MTAATQDLPPPARVLITGGAGFIGTHLAERLCGRAEVVLFDNFRRDSLQHAPHLRSHPRVRLITGDVLDPAGVAAAVEGVDTVLHLAAIAGVSSYYHEPLTTLRVNVLGTANLLEAAARAGVRRFVGFSTSEIFGPDALWVDESSSSRIGPASDARWVYATSKLAAERFCLQYGAQYGFAAAVVRPFNIYGPRQTGEGAISNFCRAAAAGEPLVVYGDGTAIRAWCYIDDFADAIEAILRAPGAAGKDFNLGNPREVETTLGLARRVARLVPGARIESRPVARSEVRARIPVIDRAREVLGFEPRVDLDEGLRRTLAWFNERRPGGASS
jgi:UDP-glucose 4-epimerase